MKQWVQSVATTYAGLAPRERLLISTAGALFGIAVLYLIVVSPILNAAERSDERLVTADQQLRLMQRLRREYDDVEQRLADVEGRIRSSPRGNLRTALETLAGEASVKVESMEPQASPANDTYRETKVEVGLRSVTLAQIVNYLHRIESAPQVLSVKALRIRTRPEQPELLDVTFTVSSFEPL
ncbi:MAG: type II secretion system protein M [Myxococcales bacterium]|nr:type II secretion system protein M [Myxococcales bacterium]